MIELGFDSNCTVALIPVFGHISDGMNAFVSGQTDGKVSYLYHHLFVERFLDDYNLIQTTHVVGLIQ